MKKIAAIFLLVTMIICSSGSLISYQLNLYSIRLHQKEIILHSEALKERIQTFVFPKNYKDNKKYDVVFEDDDEDEMMVNGKMYDIIGQRISGDSIIINCISDEREDEVRAEASRQMNSNDSPSAHENSFRIKFDHGDYNNKINTTVNATLVLNSSEAFISADVNPEHLFFVNVPSPPPWHRSFSCSNFS